uniref:BRCA2 DNA repair associated n=1 Tax=Amphilophus citrinellus TaxID=61819 RepID=A0A3Q0R597_AMPCI
MYDTFKDKIWKGKKPFATLNSCDFELGPLDPDWFEVLTAQTSANEASGSDQDELCANQEGLFKTPLYKTAVGSQPFSTPKDFRHSRIVSPETEDEQSFSAAQGNISFRFDYFYAYESLGVQMNPDISWTSSLNTPPAVPSTLILCKSVANLVILKGQKRGCSVLAEPVSPQTSLTQNGVQQKMLLDARADGEACNTVAGVADEPGNVSSTFLANSSSSLRKVKPDRVRQKRIKSNEHDCSATDIRTTNSSNEEGKADEELGTVPPSPPVKTGSTGISQWSPLSLSEIPPYTADSSILTELQTDSDSRQLIRSPLKIADSGFIRKKRKFIYTVETLKPQVQENETDFQKMDTSLGIPDSESSSKQSADTTDEDLDMSQLHRDFAQDFTEISDSGKLSKVVAEDQNYFSPSACLLAMKQVKQKRQQANLHRDCNSISNTGHMSTTSQNYSISEGTISDSGFQSAVADSTHTASSFIVPCLENTGSKTDTHRTTPFPSTHKGNGKSQLKERQTLNSERESQLDVESTLTQLPRSPTGTVDGLNCIPLNGEVHGSLPEKPSVPVPSVHASGFRTASNKGIQISLANLEKARHLLEESKSERTLRDQPNKCNRALPSVSERFEGVSCHLTASEKADVKELCILMEEADSQFEFTQFKTAEVKQPCQENACAVEGADKDLDPDFLAGIDFDDSFSSDAEKHKSTDVLMSGTVKQENISVQDVLPSSENKENPLMLDVAFKTAGGNALRVSKTCLSKARALFADLEINVSDLSSSDKQGGPHPDAVEMNSSGVLDFKNPASFIETPVSTSKLLPCSASKIIDSVTINELSSGVGFCTASGKKVSVSADAMKKAKHLLCDTYTLEDTGTKPNALRTEQLTKEYLLSESDKVDDKIDVKPPRYKIPVNAPVPSNGGFLSASGKKITLSSDALQKAKARFSDISFSAEIPVIPHTRNSDNCENADQMQNGFTADGGKVHISEKSILKGFEDSVLTKAMQETEDCDMNVNNGMSVKLESLEPVRGSGSELEIRPDRRATLNISVASANKQVKQKDTLPLQSGGFSTASGKRVSISSDALKRAKSLLGECDKVDDKINVNMSHLKTPVCGPLSKSGGFHAASGKPVL